VRAHDGPLGLLISSSLSVAYDQTGDLIINSVHFTSEMRGPRDENDDS
jgi:hypothetical protein